MYRFMIMNLWWWWWWWWWWWMYMIHDYHDVVVNDDDDVDDDDDDDEWYAFRHSTFGELQQFATVPRFQGAEQTSGLHRNCLNHMSPVSRRQVSHTLRCSYVADLCSASLVDEKGVGNLERERERERERDTENWYYRELDLVEHDWPFAPQTT